MKTWAEILGQAIIADKKRIQRVLSTYWRAQNRGRRIFFSGKVTKKYYIYKLNPIYWKQIWKLLFKIFPCFMTVAPGDAAMTAWWSNRILFLINMVKFYFIPKGICLFKVNSRNIRERCEMCSKLYHVSLLTLNS